MQNHAKPLLKFPQPSEDKREGGRERERKSGREGEGERD